MDFDLNDGQQLVVSNLQTMFQSYSDIPNSARGARSYFAADLWEKLQRAGFLNIKREMGNVEAALVVMEAARLPVVSETGATALVAANLLGDNPAGPVTLMTGDPMRPCRMLSVAKTVLLDTGEDILVIPVEAAQVENVETMLAYPYGRFKSKPDFSSARKLGTPAVAKFRQWARVALSAEATGAAQSALDYTVEYVKQRKAFGQSLGAFQAIQHRLAQCHQITRGMYFNTLYAAWSGEPLRADMAAAYAQQHAAKIVFDLHQFTGAIGLTTEYKLHYWTFRLRALQPEFGGCDGSALDVAAHLWGKAAA
jgi:alkylation response protein AidB-like acyl-CoA dehydrogenase